MNPLSTLLEHSGTGFQFRIGITSLHLLYRDDLKFLASNAATFSGSIRMQLGVHKYAVVHIDRGQVS